MSGFQLPPGMTASAPPQGAGGSGGGGQGGQASAEEQAKAAQQDEMKRSMIAAMLAPEARERLSRIALTRPTLARQVEDLLVRMGQAGQIRGQVGDEALKGLLEQVSNPPKVTTAAPTSARTRTLGNGITIQRKRDDSDSDEYDL